MTTHVLPDGTVASCPDILDTPPAPAVSVLARVSERLGLPSPDDVVGRIRLADGPETFIPAVHGVSPVERAARELDATLDLDAVRQSPEFWAAVGRLHVAVRGAA